MRELVIKRIPVVDPKNKVNEVVVNIYYDKGGHNHFTGKNINRGYYGSVLGVKREEVSVRFTAPIHGGVGAKIFLEEANRFSQKKLDDLYNDKHVLAKMDTLTQIIMAESDLKVAEI